ncbi:MAG TPA: ubiquitin-like domain-containing protein [Candidatus Microsaccharimonas sp.]
MRLIIRRSTTLWGTGIIVGLLLFISLFALIHGRADAQSGTGGRLITIHDRGQEKVLLSDAATVGDAIKAAGITIDSHDAVEPAATEKLVASEYQVNIYRARPVTVIDGGIRQKIVTAYQTAEQIVKDAGISLYPEDTTKLSQSDDILANGAGLALTIDRATPFNFTLYGAKSVARTQGATVADMLKEKGITIGVNDRVSVPLTTAVTPDLDVQVWREGKQTITVAEPVTFDTQTIRDADREVGYKAVQTAGVNGSKNVTYEIEIRDGNEVNRTAIASIVTAQSSAQVVVVGSKLPTPTNPTENQALGHIMMLNAGFGEEQWSCLYNLWTKESGWRTTAGNTSSGAYGIPQALPATKMASYGSDYLTNAQTQIAWGLNYIQGRYGTPCSAWSTSQSKGWY